MPNITLTVPAEVLRAAKIHAAEQGTSVSGLVRDYLTSLPAKGSEIERLRRLQEELWAEIDADDSVTFSASERQSRDEMYDLDARRRERQSLQSRDT